MAVRTGRGAVDRGRWLTGGIPAGLLILALAYHYAPVLVWLARVWVIRPQFSHGALVAVISLILIWLLRRRIAAAPRSTGWAGMVLVVFALALRRCDLGAAEPALAALGIPFLVFGAVWTVAGFQVAKVIAAPTFILLLGIPLPPGLMASVAMRVEFWAATAGAALLTRVFSIPATQEGVMIHLPRVSVETGVGIHPAAFQILMAFTTFAALYAYLLVGPVWKRWVVLVAGVAISVLAAGARVGLDGLVGHILGPVAMQSCHLCSGYIALIVAFACLMVTAKAIGCQDLRLPSSPSSQQ